jgi:hypothetical protein
MKSNTLVKYEMGLMLFKKFSILKYAKDLIMSRNFESNGFVECFMYLIFEKMF